MPGVELAQMYGFGANKDRICTLDILGRNY